MKAVLVTGAGGFIGKHLCARLEQQKDVELFRYGRNNSREELVRFSERAEFVFHLAGINRPQNIEEFDEGNRGFTQELLELLEAIGRRVPLVLTSSIQAELGNPYGVSKRAAEEAVFEWARRGGGPAYVYRLANVFGKWCKPNYNSVVATFCHNIARGLPIQNENPRIQLTLVYIDDVVRELIGTMDGVKHMNANGFGYVPRTFTVSLQQLVDTLYSFAGSRKTLIVPNFEGALERFLYATYTSYLPVDRFGYELGMKHDDRGWLAEFIKSRQFGQIFISRTKPGITRGNHWHDTKAEKVVVIEGEALIRLRKVGAEGVVEYRVSAKQLEVIDIPVGYIHAITNVGRTDLITLFWADEIFDPAESDTYLLGV